MSPAKWTFLSIPCHTNWDGTSTAMGAQITVEGFLSSVDTYDLKYKQLVGDGDSSVYV
jgi:hypothetical protein